MVVDYLPSQYFLGLMNAEMIACGAAMFLSMLTRDGHERPLLAYLPFADLFLLQFQAAFLLRHTDRAG
jgi:hypothetical protein